MSLYDDFPACLPRYAWLIEASGRNPAVLFNDTEHPSCKACGASVHPRDFKAHRREHVNQLKQTARQRERENAARLRAITRLRAETRAATAPPPFVAGAHQLELPEGDPNA